MRPLKRDKPSDARRLVLDIETQGLGFPVTKDGRARPPRQVLCVLYDGSSFRRFWGPTAIQDALSEVIAEGVPTDVWAHYGGGFDFRFAFPWLWAIPDVKWRLTTVGSIVLSCEGKPHGTFLRLRDSIRLLPGSLRALGDSLGYGKKDWNHDWHQGVSFRLHAPVCYSAFAEYCERDCLILWKALERVEAFSQGEGVELRGTIASTATASIRRKLTEETVAWAPGAIEEVADRANVGGRVERFEEWCDVGEVFDFQSSYPRAMLEPLPWRYAETRPRYAPGAGVGMVEATVRVRDDVFIPVLPYRIPEGPEKGRLFFPTGQWSGVFGTQELDYAIGIGAASLVSVEAFHRFDTATVLADFAASIWERRRVAVDEFDRYALKIWMNAVYGKTAESPDKEECVIRPDKLVCPRHVVYRRGPNEKCGCKLPVIPELGLYSHEYRRQPAFRAPWVAGAITGIARVRLHREGLSQAVKQGGRVFYLDTDSVTTNVTLPTGRELGALARERAFKNGRFLGAKLYAYECVDCKRPDHPHQVVKAKGFPPLTRAQFDALADGEEIAYARTEGFKEACNRGNIVFRRVLTSRAHRGTRPKRPAGRPWQINELLTSYAPVQ